MKLFDAHSHLPSPEALERAATAGVERIVVCGTSPDDWVYCIDAHKKFQCLENLPVIYPSIGIHPWFVPADGGINSKDCHSLRSLPHHDRDEASLASLGWKKSFQTLEEMVRAYAIGEKGAPTQSVGIGETGLDFQEKFTNRAEQEECFAAHLDLARELNRPVTVHCVQAWGRLIDILKEHPAPKIVLHAFGGAVELIPELTELNCTFSFCGNVTNPNAKRVRAAAVAVPADRLLIETDAPDFPPAGCDPPNEPANLVHVAQTVAELRGVPVEEIAELTFDNAQKVFGSTGTN